MAVPVADQAGLVCSTIHRWRSSCLVAANVQDEKEDLFWFQANTLHLCVLHN